MGYRIALGMISGRCPISLIMAGLIRKLILRWDGWLPSIARQGMDYVSEVSVSCSCVNYRIAMLCRVGVWSLM